MKRDRLRRLLMDLAQFVAGCVFRVTCLSGLMARKTLDYRVVRRAAGFANLPRGFDGFRVLHLSDLHIDGIVDEGRSLCQLVETLDCDLCVVTGDYRFGCDGDFDRVIDLMKDIVPRIRSRHGVVAILGDHDAIEMAPALEDLGMRVLLNDATSVTVEHETIWIAGVDGTSLDAADVSAAVRAVPPGGYTILLAHSPESAADGAALGVDLCLAGHTHGGQLCLPFGVPVVTNARSPRSRAKGAWTIGSMQGFTSRGVGASGLQARLFCPPEIILHELRVVESEPAREEREVEPAVVGASTA